MAAALNPDAVALQRAAAGLLALGTGLRSAVPADPALTLAACDTAVRRFEREAAAGGADERTVVAASYLLCAWLDEIVAGTPWGQALGGDGLLQRHHQEAVGVSKALPLIDRLLARPGEPPALLWLCHACLGLGLQGGARGRPDAAAQLERRRAALFDALATAAEEPLSPPWIRPPHTELPRRRPWGWLVVTVLALLVFGVYAGLRLQLASRADAVFAALQTLEPRGPAASPSAGPPRLATALRDEVATHRLVVDDARHRSTVVLDVTRCFDAGTGRLGVEGRALLARVGTAVAAQADADTPRSLLVRAVTDAQGPRSARFPSAWDQTLDWATQSARVLQPAVPGAQIAVESAGVGAAPRGWPPRRIEIVWFP